MLKFDEGDHKRLSARATSDLAEIFYAILELKAERILIAEIVNYLNRDRAPKECFTNKEVGSLVSVLGFAKKHTKRGTAVIWNDKIVKRLGEQYGLVDEGDGVTKKSGKTEIVKTTSVDSIFDSNAQRK